MHTTLYKLVNSHSELSAQHIQSLMYQILKGLKYIHSAQVIHGYLKPSNLLINSDYELKIRDFGFIKFIAQPIDQELSVYETTEWYRAPELLFNCPFDYKIDVWSAGKFNRSHCVFFMFLVLVLLT